MSLPDGVTVRQEWAIHSVDGHVYETDDATVRTASRELALLRAGVDGEPGEIGASLARRYVMTTPDGEVATMWRWNL